MTNEQVISNYFNNVNCHSLNVYSSGDNLINYNTIMVHREANIYYVNISYYSVTTSKIQNYINGELDTLTSDYKIIYYYGDRYGDNYLIEKSQIKFIGEFDYNIIVEKLSMITIDKYYIYFRLKHYNTISNVIDRKILTDKNNDQYFKFDNVRYYLKYMKIYDNKNLSEIVDR